MPQYLLHIALLSKPKHRPKQVPAKWKENEYITTEINAARWKHPSSLSDLISHAIEVRHQIASVFGFYSKPWSFKGSYDSIQI